jgi:hypothetical protein
MVAGLSPVGAQTPPPVANPPFNVTLPNYTTVPVGELASLEAGAFVARANDTSSAFYNPAGLTRAERTSISGNAGVFQFGSVSPEGLNQSGGSFQQIPAMFAFVLNNLMGREQWAGGLSVARVNAWMQGVDAERTLAAGTSSDRIAYSSESAISGWLVNMGAGYSNSNKLRLGGSIDVQLTTTERRQSIADQFRTPTGLAAVLVGSRGTGWMTHLRLSAGAQYDLTPSVTVGALVRSGGLGLMSSGTTSLEGLSRVGSVTTTASFLDASPDVEYRLPVEFKAGAAWKGTRAQVEIDILAFTGTGDYDSFTSDETLTVLVDQGTGTPPLVQVYPFRPPVVDSRSVVNVAIGGAYNLRSDGAWVLHGGYATDGSPVGDRDTTFTKINLNKITGGVSGRTKYFLGSAGLQYTTGTSDTILLAPLQNGQEVTTRIKMKNLGFLYSLALLF